MVFRFTHQISNASKIAAPSVYAEITPDIIICCFSRYLLTKNCNNPSNTNEMEIIHAFTGKNRFIKKRLSCAGDVPSVINRLISALQDAMVSCINKVKINRANNSISDPLIPDMATTVSTIFLYLLNLVFSASVVNWCLRR